MTADLAALELALPTAFGPGDSGRIAPEAGTTLEIA
jgi:hypothetical protein